MPHTGDTSTSVTSTDPPNANDPSAPTSEETESVYQAKKMNIFEKMVISTYKWLLYHATQDTDFEMLKLCISKSVFRCMMNVTYDKGTHLKPQG